SAAECDFDAVAVSEFDQLSGNVPAVLAFCFRRQICIAFPIPISTVRVGRGGRGVGDVGGGGNAGGKTSLLGLLEKGRYGVFQAGGAITASAFRIHADEARLGLDAAHDGGHGAGGIRRLLVGVVGAGEGNGGQALEGQAVLLAGFSLLLSIEYARGGDGGNAHAVADE